MIHIVFFTEYRQNPKVDAPFWIILTTMNLPFKTLPTRMLSGCLDDFGSLFPEKIRALSWNLLAPCWKRTSYGREGTHPQEWKHRLSQGLEQLMSLNCDLLCIQELWFDEEYLKLFCGGLSERYIIFALQRVHNKPDGIAILIKKGMFPAPISLGFDFHDFGSRVGLMISWDDLSLLNTHLTFPHNNQYDKKIRMTQALDIVQILEENPNIQQLVVGDLNGSIYDEAVKMLITNAQLHPMNNHDDFVTHHSHRGDKMACDLFLARRPCFQAVQIHPIDLELSDHAMVEVLIHTNAD